MELYICLILRVLRGIKFEQVDFDWNLEEGKRNWLVLEDLKSKEDLLECIWWLNLIYYLCWFLSFTIFLIKFVSEFFLFCWFVQFQSIAQFFLKILQIRIICFQIQCFRFAILKIKRLKKKNNQNKENFILFRSPNFRKIRGLISSSKDLEEICLKLNKIELFLYFWRVLPEYHISILNFGISVTGRDLFHLGFFW